MGRSRQGFSVNSNGFPCSIFERGEVCALLKWPTPSSVSGDFLPNYCVAGSITASGFRIWGRLHTCPPVSGVRGSELKPINRFASGTQRGNRR